MSNYGDQVLAAAIRFGLQHIAKNAANISDHIIEHPEDISAAIEGANEVNKQFDDVLDKASKFSDERAHFRGSLESLAQKSEWLTERFSTGECSGHCVPVSNAFGRVVSSFSEL